MKFHSDKWCQIYFSKNLIEVKVEKVHWNKSELNKFRKLESSVWISYIFDDIIECEKFCKSKRLNYFDVKKYEIADDFSETVKHIYKDCNWDLLRDKYKFLCETYFNLIPDYFLRYYNSQQNEILTLDLVFD